MKPANKHPLLRVRYGELLLRISRARNMDLAALNDDQVFHRIHKIMDGYTTIPMNLMTNMVFRARKNIGNSPFDHSSDLWYPPAPIVPRGRFNESGQSKFYASNRFSAALFETQPQIGDIFTVLAVRSRALRQVVCAHIGMERCTAPEVTLGLKGRQLRQHPAMRYVFEQKGTSSCWLAIDQYLGDLATSQCPPGQSDNFFKPTNALAAVLSRIPGIAVLQYPSVAASMKAVNLCLTPEKADELFVPGEAWMVEIVDHKQELPGAPSSEAGYYGVRFLFRSEEIAADGRLIWHPANGQQAPPYLFGQPRF